MMWRRQFITLGAGLIALTAVPAVGQEGAVSADRIRSVYSNDELFERMVLSLYALRATLYLANPETDANALSAFNSSNTMFAASMAEADKERSTVLAAINQDPERRDQRSNSKCDSKNRARVKQYWVVERIGNSYNHD
jgi:hypothetical protein